jgi:hypothetical protein
MEHLIIGNLLSILTIPSTGSNVEFNYQLKTKGPLIFSVIHVTIKANRYFGVPLYYPAEAAIIIMSV